MRRTISFECELKELKELTTNLDTKVNHVNTEIRSLKEIVHKQNRVIEDLNKQHTDFIDAFDGSNVEKHNFQETTENTPTEQVNCDNKLSFNIAKDESAKSARNGQLPNEATCKNIENEEKSDCRNLIKRFVESSTLHGLSKLADTSVWVRVLWLFAIAGAMAALVLQITGLTRNYLSFNVITDVNVKQGNLTFPAITVCNNRRFLASRLVSLPLFANLSAQVNDPSTASELSKRLKERYFDLTPEDLSYLAANVSDTVEVGSNRGKGDIKAIPYHGSCYSIELPSETETMWIVFNLHINDSIDTEETEPGFTMFLKDNLKAYHTLRPMHKIEVQQGKLSNHIISHDVIDKLSGSYAKCQDDEQTFLRTGSAYEKYACYLECMVQDAFLNCRCLPGWRFLAPSIFKYRLETNYSVPLCDVESPCLRKVLDNYMECICKPRCHRKIYTETSQRTYDIEGCQVKPMDWFCSIVQKWTAENFSREWYRTNFAASKVMMTVKPYKIYTQRPGYPLLHFLADIGGTMGFYLGASMLTYFEFIQLFLSISANLLYRIKCTLINKN